VLNVVPGAGRAQVGIGHVVELKRSWNVPTRRAPLARERRWILEGRFGAVLRRDADWESAISRAFELGIA